MTYLFVLAGIALLYFGGEWLVTAGAALGRRLGVSPLVIGLTVVAFGTSCPELATSLEAAAMGSTTMAFGNVVGSNIANVGLVLGIGAMLTTIAATRRFMMRDVPVLVVSALLTWALAMDGVVERWEGIALLLTLLGYLSVLVWGARHGDDSLLEEVPEDTHMSVPRASFGAAVGVGMLILGARLLVHGGEDLARDFGVSERIIGLTLVAVGTSLPELASTIVACMKGQDDMAMGNVVGSNIFNVLAILGTTATVHPVRIDASSLPLDMGTMLLLSVLVPLITARGPAGKPSGVLLLCIYGSYLLALAH